MPFIPTETNLNHFREFSSFLYFHPSSEKELVSLTILFNVHLPYNLQKKIAISYEMRRVMDSFDYSLFLGYKGHICGNRVVSSVYSQPLGCQHKCAHLQTRSPEGSFGSFHPCEQ